MENEYAWQVPVEEIVKRNYNLDISNPHVGEQISHDPDVLLAHYKVEQQRISDLRSQLKAILAEALTNKGK